MRTDVKIGLICAFVIVLSVVIYFVYQGNNQPRATQAQPNTPVIAAPANPRPNDGLTVAPPPGNAGLVPSTPGGVTGEVIRVGGTTQPGTSNPTPTVNGIASNTPNTFNPGTIGGTTTPPSTTPPSATPPSTPGRTELGLGGSLAAGPTTPGNSGPTVDFGPPTRSTPGQSPFGSSPLGGSSTPSSNNTGTSLGGSLPGTRNPAENFFPGSVTTYKIQKGDMLGPIAKKFNVSVKAIEAANPGLDANRLQVNQQIKIPAAGGTNTSGTDTATGATPGNGSQRIGAIPPTTRPGATPTNTTTGNGAIRPGTTYTVKKNDTLSTIALSAYGDKNAWQRIYTANRSALADPNNVPVGTVLRIPQ